MGSDHLGSYHHAVTTGDGTWLTRGFFSQNHTSSNSLRAYYPDETKTHVMLCGRHVACAHVTWVSIMLAIHQLCGRHVARAQAGIKKPSRISRC